MSYEALKALWPDSLTASEMFGSITLPKRIGLYGSYKSFLSCQLSEGLTPANLPVALDWVATQRMPSDPGHPWRDLVQAIVRKSWNFLDRDEVASRVVKLVAQWFGESNGFWPPEDMSSDDAFWTDAESRRIFIRLMIDRLEEPVSSYDSPASRGYEIAIYRLQRVVAEQRCTSRPDRSSWNS